MTFMALSALSVLATAETQSTTSFILNNNDLLEKKLNIYIEVLDESNNDKDLQSVIEADVRAELKKIRRLAEINFMLIISYADKPKPSNRFIAEQRGLLDSIINEAEFTLDGNSANLNDDSSLSQRLKATKIDLVKINNFIAKLIKEYDL